MSRNLRLSPAEVDELWARWRSGQAIRVLCREMRVNHSVVRDLIYRCGGIRPAPRRRWEVRLSAVEREETSRGPGCRALAPRDRRCVGPRTLDGLA